MSPAAWSAPFQLEPLKTTGTNQKPEAQVPQKGRGRTPASSVHLPGEGGGVLVLRTGLVLAEGSGTSRCLRKPSVKNRCDPGSCPLTVCRFRNLFVVFTAGTQHLRSVKNNRCPHLHGQFHSSVGFGSWFRFLIFVVLVLTI